VHQIVLDETFALLDEHMVLVPAKEYSSPIKSPRMVA
jgi:hypothetical protein